MKYSLEITKTVGGSSETITIGSDQKPASRILKAEEETSIQKKRQEIFARYTVPIPVDSVLPKKTGIEARRNKN